VLHLEVAVSNELVEVVAGYVGVDLEQLGNLGRSYCFGRLSNRDIDPAARRVAERCGQVADLLVEQLCVHGVVLFGANPRIRVNCRSL
jgi:hypothetical protein